MTRNIEWFCCIFLVSRNKVNLPIQIIKKIHTFNCMKPLEETQLLSVLSAYEVLSFPHLRPLSLPLMTSYVLFNFLLCPPLSSSSYVLQLCLLLRRNNDDACSYQNNEQTTTAKKYTVFFNGIINSYTNVSSRPTQRDVGIQRDRSKQDCDSDRH